MFEIFIVAVSAKGEVGAASTSGQGWGDHVTGTQYAGQLGLMFFVVWFLIDPEFVFVGYPYHVWQEDSTGKVTCDARVAKDHRAVPVTRGSIFPQ